MISWLRPAGNRQTARSVRSHTSKLKLNLGSIEQTARQMRVAIVVGIGGWIRHGMVWFGLVHYYLAWHGDVHHILVQRCSIPHTTIRLNTAQKCQIPERRIGTIRSSKGRTYQTLPPEDHLSRRSRLALALISQHLLRHILRRILPLVLRCLEPLFSHRF